MATAVQLPFILVCFLLCLSCSYGGSGLVQHIKLINGTSNNTKTYLDLAHIDVVSKLTDNLTMWVQTEICYKCLPFQVPDFILPSAANASLFVDAKFPLTVVFKQMIARDYNETSNHTVIDQEAVCNLTRQFREYGEYSLYIMKNPNTSMTDQVLCNLIVIDENHDPNMPILIAFLIYLGLAILWILIQQLYRRNIIYKLLCCLKTDHLVHTDLGAPTNNGSVNPVENEKAPVKAKERLKSLDTFRGLSLVIMIFVNYGGGKYWFFNHSRWNGLTVADLVFPWFVFIMGTAMAFTYRGMKRRATSTCSMLLKIIQRSITLFCLGLLVNSGWGNNDFEILRIPGVLQRFAITYLVVALMEVCFAKAQDRNEHQYVWWSSVRDLVFYWPEWLLMFLFLSAYIIITYDIPRPDYHCPRGYTGPGGLHEGGQYSNCTGGIAGYIDRWVLGDHIYQSPTCKEVYQTVLPFDPEGILGTLTSIVICFFGLHAGKIIITYGSWKERVVRWSIWGIILGIITLILTKGTQDEGWVPINKNLWSVSYVLAMSSLGFFLLAACYLTIDVYKWWSGAPFFYAGMNSIFLYVGHETLGNFIPISFKVPSTHAAQLAMDLWGATFWVIVSIYMYYKKIFITV